jgi:(1->4)-alpha-D-glucan 1-alpha-D-glucosylmutase
MRVVTAALRLRRDRADTFTDGGYTPVLAEGAAAEHLVAFLRADDALTAVTRHSVVLAETQWGDTSLTLPDGVWVDRVGGGRFSGRVPATDLFAELPVALLERVDG